MHRPAKDLRDTINILFEDESCMVFDKPAGLLVIPTPRNEKNTLINIVNEKNSAGNRTCKLHPCHRLDRETSGAIIFAKGKKNQKLFAELFRQREINKKYIAFVHGKLNKKAGVYKGSIKDLDERRYNKHATAKYAETHYKVLEERKDYSIVEVGTITGRTNQIRIHFSKNGHPLLGDRKYSIAKNYSLKFRRTALHAAHLEWNSLSNGQKIKITSEIPEDMSLLLTRNF